MWTRSPTDPHASPEYWWAEEIVSGKIAPVELWRTTSPSFNDGVVVFGDAEGYDAKFWRLIERISPLPTQGMAPDLCTGLIPSGATRRLAQAHSPGSVGSPRCGLPTWEKVSQNPVIAPLYSFLVLRRYISARKVIASEHSDRAWHRRYPASSATDHPPRPRGADISPTQSRPVARACRRPETPRQWHRWATWR